MTNRLCRAVESLQGMIISSLVTESWIVWVGRDCNSCLRQGQHPQAARNFVLSGLENFQGWKLCSFSEHSCCTAGASSGEMFLLISSLNLKFQFMTIVSHSSAIISLERAWLLVDTGKFSSKPSLPWAEQAHFLLTAQVLQPSWCAHGVLLAALHWAHYGLLVSALYWGPKTGHSIPHFLTRAK